MKVFEEKIESISGIQSVKQEESVFNKKWIRNYKKTAEYIDSFLKSLKEQNIKYDISCEDAIGEVLISLDRHRYANGICVHFLGKIVKVIAEGRWEISVGHLEQYNLKQYKLLKSSFEEDLQNKKTYIVFEHVTYLHASSVEFCGYLLSLIKRFDNEVGDFISKYFLHLSNVSKNSQVSENSMFGNKALAVALVVDISEGMRGESINKLNHILKEFGDFLQQEGKNLGVMVDITIISFNSTVQIEMPFKPASECQAPELVAGGGCVLNEALNTALNVLEDRKRLYRENCVKYFRPYLLVLTGGKDTDKEKAASTKARLRDYIERRKVGFMPMGMGKNVDIANLEEYYPERARYKVVPDANARNLKECFSWC